MSPEVKKLIVLLGKSVICFFIGHDWEMDPYNDQVCERCGKLIWKGR